MPYERPAARFLPGAGRSRAASSAAAALPKECILAKDLLIQGGKN
jgi:hypothetical protein